MNPASEALRKRLLNPLQLNLFMLLKLPAAFFCGVRLSSLTHDEAVASMPYKWLTQNPFKSTYFACLAMAAEFSSGALVLLAVEGKPKVSMLVTDLRAQFVKKAVSRTFFTCADGAAIRAAVEKTRATGEGVTVTTVAIGRNAQGEEVARFDITWSLKAKLG